MGIADRRKHSFKGSIAAAALVAFTQSVPAHAQQQTYRFDIPAQELGSALRTFARAARQQVTFDDSAVQGKRAPALKGSFTADQALDILLSGSGLSAQRGQSGLFIVRPVADARSPSPRTASSSLEDARATDIVVTGTNIRGAPPSSPVFVYSAADLERSGYGTIEEFIEAVPQNFGGGADGGSADGILGQGFFRLTNRTAATSVNLRGLGGTSTLVLVNGHRIAPAIAGKSVDVSQFPIGAVERIEIVPDGASAVYGSDAIAGVVNIILKRDYEGAETLLRHSFTTEGGRRETTVSQAVGTNWGRGGIMGSFQYQRQTPLHAEDRSFAKLLPLPHDLLPGAESYNASISARQEIGTDAEIYLDGLYNNREGYRRNTAANEQLRQVDYAATSYSLAGGIKANFTPGWQLEVASLFSRQDEDYVENRLSLANVAQRNAADQSYEMFSVDAIIRGRFGESVRSPGVAFGGSLRGERLYQFFNNANGTSVSERSVDRDALAFFAEITQPLVVPEDSIPLVHSLTLSGAIRYDDYSDFGTTTNYRAGAVWQPVTTLKLRANYNTSFRAPTVTEQFDFARPMDARTVRVAAPSGSGQVTILSLSGGGLPLGPETARSYSFGFEFTPAGIEGLQFGVNYYDIRFKNRITRPSLNAQVLLQPDVYEDILLSFASDAEVQDFVDALIAVPGGEFDDRVGTGIAGIRAAVDLRTRNLAVLDQTGFDIFANYSRPLGSGTLTARANVSIINHIRTRLSPTATAVDIVDTIDNPLRLRLRGDLGWSGDFGAVSVAVNHAGAYTNSVVAPFEAIDAWTTVDLVGRLNLGWLSGNNWLRATTLGVTVKNLFNQDPPYIRQFSARTVNYDIANASPENRVVGLELRAKW